MKNMFYFTYLNSIGGVESFFYYMVKKYQKKDITIVYKSGSQEQVRRLSKYARVLKYSGGIIKCQKAFFNYNLDIIDHVEAEEYIQVIHADYKALKLKPNLNPKITRYIGVSKQACRSFKELTGLDIELCYNPIVIDKPKKVLNLISATRLTAEKGKNRMIEFARQLDEAGIKYIWTIFTNDVNAIDNPNVIYMKPRLDIIDYIANSDYLVQLSDNEAYCYSVVEALCVGTPVIVTDCPVFKEIGVNQKNGYILDFDLKNVPIEKIYNEIPTFEYRPKADRWNNIMAYGKRTYDPNDIQYVLVKPIKKYYDLVRKEKLTPSTPPFKVLESRGTYLCNVGVCEMV